MYAAHFFEIGYLPHISDIGQSDRNGFWHGDPNPDSIDALYKYFSVGNDFELGLKPGSSCRWIMPEHTDMWQNPKREMFDVLAGEERKSLNQP